MSSQYAKAKGVREGRRTCIVVFDEFSEFFLCLVFGDGFGVDHTFFDQPGSKLWLLVVQARVKCRKVRVKHQVLTARGRTRSR